MSEYKFEVLTSEEVEIVMGSIKVLRGDLNQLSTIEMVKDNKILGWLVMGKIKKDGKSVEVGIAHKELAKPLFFADKKDATKYIKLIKFEMKKLKDETTEKIKEENN